MSWRSLVILCLGWNLASAAEPEVRELAKIPPTPPEKALATFRVKPGFHAELAAAEPLVMDPVALAFDENGRLYVAEMRDYSERREERLGRIRLLEDVDGDGRFDKSTVFADQLAWPTAVICYDGGIFVCATPDIFYLKDTNGDGVADEKRVVFTGLGQGVDRLNVQRLPNSFNWGLDNRIHGANGGNGGSLVAVGAGLKSKPLELRGSDFSFDPRTLEIRLENGGGQNGLSFDNRGRKFVCSNSSHLQALMYEERYSARNPRFILPHALVDIAVDGPAAEVYRISPDEPWRVLRTQWRVAGLVPGPIEGGGRPSGYFTGATGATIYRGNAFPEDFMEDAFVADCGSNLVHRKKVRRDGVGFKAERPADEQKVEFLASTDNWFRPVQFANAPDGTLYFADMYREVIEHPWSLPDSLKKHLDLNSGNDRGRIYRLVPDGFKQPPLPHLGRLGIAELVATLEHRNGWHRDTAQRLLYERQDPAAAPELKRLIRGSKSPLARLHALHALRSQSALTSSELTAALSDGDEAVRQHAVRLSEELLLARETGSELVARKLIDLADDPSLLVRYQLAFTLGQDWSHPDQPKALAKILRRDAGDHWVESAVLSSLKEGAAAVLATLAADERFRSGGSGVSLLGRLAGLVAASGRPEEVAAVLQSLAGASEAGFRFSLLGAVTAGLRRAGHAPEKFIAPDQIKPVLQEAGTIALEDQKPESLRIAAVRLLGAWPESSARPGLLSLLEPKHPGSLQSAALSALQSLGTPTFGQDLLERWPQFTPGLRTEVLQVLLKRKERIAELFEALDKGRLHPSDLSAAQLAFLRSHPDAVTRQRANRLLGAVAETDRAQIIEALLPALNLRGELGHGGAIFASRCASCHRFGGSGPTLGPDLVTAKSMGKEKLLINLLDPNREVAPGFLSYLVETKDGESFTGIIGDETGASLTLKQPDGLENSILRSNIRSIQSQGRSAMPEGLEAGLSQQDIADLLEFIVSGKAQGH